MPSRSIVATTLLLLVTTEVLLPLLVMITEIAEATVTTTVTTDTTTNLLVVDMPTMATQNRFQNKVVDIRDKSIMITPHNNCLDSSKEGVATVAADILPAVGTRMTIMLQDILVVVATVWNTVIIILPVRKRATIGLPFRVLLLPVDPMPVRAVRVVPSEAITIHLRRRHPPP